MALRRRRSGALFVSDGMSEIAEFVRSEALVQVVILCAHNPGTSDSLLAALMWPCGQVKTSSKRSSMARHDRSSESW
jgi:hypothetical protein